MKVGILAGGLGTRLTEETEVRPKPMVEIGGKPILSHIMRHYLRHGFDHFVIALGYKGEHIKRYFVDYHTHDGAISRWRCADGVGGRRQDLRSRSPSPGSSISSRRAARPRRGAGSSACFLIWEAGRSC